MSYEDRVAAAIDQIAIDAACDPTSGPADREAARRHLAGDDDELAKMSEAELVEYIRAQATIEAILAASAGRSVCPAPDEVCPAPDEARERADLLKLLHRAKVGGCPRCVRWTDDELADEEVP